MSKTLRRGSRGFDVAVLQAQLNQRGASTAPLKVDGDFGLKTYSAVRAFQKKKGLGVDGVVGQNTREAIARGPTLTTARHTISHIPQPTPTTCWAASTAMMTRSTVAGVRAKTPAAMIASDGGLLNSSESDQAIVTGRRYGAIHGLQCHPPMSWSVGAFVSQIRRGPVMLDMLWRSDEYARGNGSPGHMVVISGVISDLEASGRGTHLLVLDPWPPGRGKISWAYYEQWISEVPTRTYRVFNR